MNLGLEPGRGPAGTREYMGMRKGLGLGPGNTGGYPQRLTQRPEKAQR